MRHHRHKKAESGSTGVQLGLIVTPMLDMSFQILAFFIATYHPSASEGLIPGSLAPFEKPPDAAVKSKDPNPIPQIPNPLSIKEEDLMPELNEALLVRAKLMTLERSTKTRPVGSLGQIFVKLPLDPADRLVADSDKSIKASIDQLEDWLRKDLEKSGRSREDRKKDPNIKSPNLKLAADGDLAQEHVMMVFSAGKRAGYDNIVFVPPPDLPKKLRVNPN